MNEVVWYDSDEVGAPTMNSTAGSVVNVFDACLIDGFNSKTLTSLVVSGGIATATASAHGYAVGKILLVAGATPSGLNGRKKILSVPTANTYTFDATGISNQTATGTITSKRAPLGWTKAFTGTGKAIYQRSDPAATALLLRVDDSGIGGRTDTFRVKMLEAASGIDTWTNDTPPSAWSLVDGQYWEKGAGNSNPKKWIIVGDSRTLYYFGECDDRSFASYGALMGHCFGDIKAYRAGDPWACVLMGSRGAAGENAFFRRSLNESSFIARKYNGIGGAQYVGFGALGGYVHGGPSYPAYPSPVDNGAVIQDRALLCEDDAAFAYPIRGEMRGMKLPLANLGTQRYTLYKTILTDVVDFSGELLVVCGVGEAGSDIGAVLFDITGPWQA